MQTKNIIVTGGSKGIGLECVKLYSKYKNNIFILDLVESKYKKENIHFYKCDVGCYQNVKKISSEIKKHFGKIDILINCAGIQLISGFEKYNYKDWSKVMNTNYFGICNTIHSNINNFSKNATILNISSVHATKPRMNKYAYDSSKSAIEILSKELALELSSKNITVNVLEFGAVNTNMNIGWTKQEKEEAKNKVPLKKIFEPFEIANFVFYIIKYFSQNTTGSVFTVDGGRSLI